MPESEKTAAETALATAEAAATLAANTAATAAAEAEQAAAAAAAVAAAEKTAEAEKAAAAEPEKATATEGVSVVLDATVADDTAAPALNELKENTDYDPDKYRDATRSYIAYWLLGLLTIVVIFSFTALVVINKGTVTFAELKSLLELLLGPIVALVSAATGFYFGSQQSTNAKKP